VRSIAENVVDGGLAAAIVVLFVALAFTSLTAAEERSGAVRPHLPQIVDVRDVRPVLDQVSGVLVNLSTKPVRSVRVRIDRSWVCAGEGHAGGAERIPAGAAVFAVPGEIAPGERWPFTHRSDAPLPERNDGHFETSVSIVGLEQVG